jgi:hypothetical protein
MSHDSWDAGLTRREDTSGAWGEGKEETWAESQEESGGDDQIGLGEHNTHRLGDEAVHEEEDESVEKHGHLTGLAVHELDVLARGGDEHTWAEREKKSGWDGNLLSGDIWDGEHLIYVYIIFHEIYKVIECCTSQHLFMESISDNNSPDTCPYIMKLFFVVRRNLFVIRIVLQIAKLYKVAELSCVCDTRILHKGPRSVPHVP